MPLGKLLSKIKIIALLVLGLTLVLPAGNLQADEIIDELEDAYEAHVNGNYEKAIKHYTRLIEAEVLLRQDLSVAFLLRGQAWAAKQDCKTAIEDFSHAIELHPVYAHAFYFRSNCYESMKKYEEAWKDIEKALFFKPDKDIYKEAKALLIAVMGKDEDKEDAKDRKKKKKAEQK